MCVHTCEHALFKKILWLVEVCIDLHQAVAKVTHAKLSSTSDLLNCDCSFPQHLIFGVTFLSITSSKTKLIEIILLFLHTGVRSCSLRGESCHEVQSRTPLCFCRAAQATGASRFIYICS